MPANLKKKLDSAVLPPELKTRAQDMLNRLQSLSQHSSYALEYERTEQYVNWIVSLPWEKTTQDKLDLATAKIVFDRHHHGMIQVKERILEYLAVLSLTKHQQLSRAPILCLVGLVGTGKTTFGSSLAEVLGRQYYRIPFGGLGSVESLRGQSRFHLHAQPGLIIRALRQTGTRNPIILLDEIDRIVDSARPDIMGILVELLDPAQNSTFVDQFIDYPFDLSDVLFLITANNTRNIATAVLDRLEIIQMPSYSDEEKIIIGKDYMLPRALRATGLSSENLTIDLAVWPQIVRPLGYDAGIRSLERTIQSICRKVARHIVAGKAKHFHLTSANIKKYLSTY